jgi:hypothetical protein
MLKIPSLALLSFPMLLLTKMRLNPDLASYRATAYPIPSEPPVTKTHPPPYLFLRSNLLLKKDAKVVLKNATILTIPMKKQKQRRAYKVQKHQSPS